MRLMNGSAIGGAGLGLAAALVLGFLVGVNWITLLVVIGLVLTGYIVAAATVRGAAGFSEGVRGFLIGLNAGGNGLVGGALVKLFAPMPAAVVVGIVLGTLNCLCVIKWVSQREVYQGIVGWCNWLFPMSWPIVALGLSFVLFSALLALVTGFRVSYLRLRRGTIDWATGTFFVKGGLVSNLNAWDTAFNMGNFSFVDMNSSQYHVRHEAGHTLNLAAFGWLFHLIGAVDEFVIQRGASAYAERLAESNDTGQAGSNIPMWA